MRIDFINRGCGLIWETSAEVLGAIPNVGELMKITDTWYKIGRVCHLVNNEGRPGYKVVVILDKTVRWKDDGLESIN